MKNRILNICTAILALTLLVGPHLQFDYFNGFYTTIKWMTVYLTAIFAGLVLVRKDWVRPQGWLLYLFLGLVVTKIIATALHLSWVSGTNFFHCVLFLSFVLSFQVLLREKQITLDALYKWFTLSGLILVCYSAWQFVRCRIVAANIDPVCFSGSFGNINMFSEYFLFTLPLVGFYCDKRGSKWLTRFTQFNLVLWVFFLLAGFSRSAWLGLGLWFALILFTKQKKQIGVALAGAALFVASLSVSSMGPDYAKAKEGSFSKRAELYKGAAVMLLDSPLGLGGGGFEYSYIPYQMGTGEPPAYWEIYTTPHEELLKWGIENGWLFLVFCIGFLALLFGILLKNIKKSAEHRLTLGVFLAFVPQMLFQFPFDNAMSFFWLAFFFAIFMNQVPQATIRSRVLPWVAGVFSILALMHFLAYTTSRTLESRNPGDLWSATVGCEVYPANWKACFWRAKDQLRTTQPEKAADYAIEELEQRPFNFEALFFLAQEKGLVPDLKATCEMVKVYDLMFARNPERDPELYNRCKEIPSPLKFTNSVQFRQDYLKWLEPYLD